MTSPASHAAGVSEASVELLFRPYKLGTLQLANRIVMAPMTRKFSPGGVPGADVAAYYRRRAEGGVGLIVTEGIYVHPSAGQERAVPVLYTPEAVEGWRKVVAEVHAAGTPIFAQLWHIGLVHMDTPTSDQSIGLMGPSGFDGKGRQVGGVMSDEDVADIIAAYGNCAAAAKAAGFDGIEIHAAHGYLIDQFMWSRTNLRSDRLGGNAIERTRFGVEVLEECRRRVGPDFPISFRVSQWKIADYTARLAETPPELAAILQPFADAGPDIFHCSTRRFWEPEFPGNPLNLAGWVKKLTGVPTITVGSVTLDTDVMTSDRPADPTDLSNLLQMMERDEFDLVAVGRAIIANPQWPRLIRRGALNELKRFVRAEADSTLY